MFNPLFSSSLYKQNNEARVGKAGVMARSHSEAEAGSLEREERGVASLSTQGWAQASRALRTRAPCTRRYCTRWGVAGAGRRRGSHGVGQSALCAPRCRCLPPPTSPLPPPGRLVFTQGNPTPAPAKPLSLPNRALPRPCGCPPAPSVPSDFLSPSPLPP